MDVISMMHVISLVANPMIRESTLLDFSSAAEDLAESMRVSALDELHGVLNGYIIRGSEK